MKIIEVNNDNFEEEVLNSDKKVLVDFNADWCGPCKMLKPVLEEMANENNNVKIVSVNVDLEDTLAYTYQVASIPCLVVFESGKEINRKVGFTPREELEEMLGE